jgi:hypothetical protein
MRPALSLCAVVVASIAATPGISPAQSNPLSRFAPPPTALVNGRWNGVDLERRANCVNAQNEGTRGTYAQFDVVADAAGTFAITQASITGLNCTYNGRYQPVDGRLGGVTGTYSCSDGKQGNFQTRAVEVNGVALTIQMGIQLTGAETCTIDAVLALGRLQ